MNEINLLGKKVLVDESKVVFKFDAKKDNYQDFFKVMAGNWKQYDGYLIGTEPGNQGGIIYTKDKFNFDVLCTMKVSTMLPATRDLNAVWCSTWDNDSDYLKESYVCGVNGWYDNLSGIERCGKNGFYTSTSLYHYNAGDEITLQFGSINGHCFMLCDGKLICEIDDPFPLHSGHVGISPYCTILKISYLEVRKIKWEKREQYYKPEF